MIFLLGGSIIHTTNNKKGKKGKHTKKILTWFSVSIPTLRFHWDKLVCNFCTDKITNPTHCNFLLEKIVTSHK